MIDNNTIGNSVAWKNGVCDNVDDRKYNTHAAGDQAYGTTTPNNVNNDDFFFFLAGSNDGLYAPILLRDHHKVDTYAIGDQVQI